MESLQQEMTHYKQKLDPVIETAVLKRDFEHKMDTYSIDLKFIGEQLFRYHSGVDKITSKNREILLKDVHSLLVPCFSHFSNPSSPPQSFPDHPLSQSLLSSIQSAIDAHKAEKAAQLAQEQQWRSEETDKVLAKLQEHARVLRAAIDAEVAKAVHA